MAFLMNSRLHMAYMGYTVLTKPNQVLKQVRVHFPTHHMGKYNLLLSFMYSLSVHYETKYCSAQAGLELKTLFPVLLSAKIAIVSSGLFLSFLQS